MQPTNEVEDLKQCLDELLESLNDYDKGILAHDRQAMKNALDRIAVARHDAAICSQQVEFNRLERMMRD